MQLHLILKLTVGVSTHTDRGVSTPPGHALTVWVGPVWPP